MERRRNTTQMEGKGSRIVEESGVCVARHRQKPTAASENKARAAQCGAVPQLRPPHHAVRDHHAHLCAPSVPSSSCCSCVHGVGTGCLCAALLVGQQRSANSHSSHSRKWKGGHIGRRNTDAHQRGRMRTPEHTRWCAQCGGRTRSSHRALLLRSFSPLRHATWLPTEGTSARTLGRPMDAWTMLHVQRHCRCQCVFVRRSRPHRLIFAPLSLVAGPTPFFFHFLHTASISLLPSDSTK
jgi:hypothetical protein